ncbi:MAG: reverse transcriptase family protein [Rickettsiaceae bacterium]|nr:MAG: reverse transcriptase family protein [Rickettsiaceae bacterium]
MDAAISQQEVEFALPKLSNGKAAGRAGWPAELLRYAAQHVTMDNGSRQKVWILAPLLTRLLNHCFHAGSLPPCISSALVTPIHKKGCTLDAANYRPIAVGEPLYRLYTIILNRRLVGWSEEHQLRSPTQAGFRPRQSPIHHLFALRHFIDTACISRRPLYACFVDLQKAYDTVQHDLLWARLKFIGVGPRMLAAIKSLYSSGTLAMKVTGTAGQPRVQQMGVRQGCPLSPTLFGLFFDGLHDRLHACAPTAGVQLRSGRWVSSLVYADDVVLLSWSASGLQLLLDGMHGFCLGIGMVISPSKTEVVVFNGPGSACSWRVGSQVLPQSSSFKYLGLVFHESGSLSNALKRLAQNAVGALFQLRSKFKRLMCDTSFPMMRRLFDALVLPTVSYGSEVWGPLCSPVLPPDIKKMADIQVSFLRQLCCLKRSVTPIIMFRELAEKPWVHRWWGQVVGFMRRLSVMPEGSIHRDILMDNIADAQDHPSYTNWANGVMRQYSLLGIASPFSSSGIVGLNAFKFQTSMRDRLCRVWDGCHVSPRTAPSKGAKLCTYFAWFFRPSQLTFEPYYDIPMPISRLRLLLQFRMGSHSLPVERGRLARPAIPRHLRRCTFCGTGAPGDERHFVFDCPHFAHVRRQAYQSEGRLSLSHCHSWFGR